MHLLKESLKSVHFIFTTHLEIHHRGRILYNQKVCKRKYFSKEVNYYFPESGEKLLTQKLQLDKILINPNCLFGQ